MKGFDSWIEKLGQFVVCAISILFPSFRGKIVFT
jgi:hypothetical protein